MTVRHLVHNRVRLALHELRGPLTDGTPGRPLLLLHGLGEASPSGVPFWAAGWPGPVVALDFTGHGSSTVPAGGGYSAETLMADADLVLEALGPCTVVGRGLGAYIALLLAGARPQLVRGAVLCDGPGLAGGAIGPTSMSIFTLPPRAQPPDPYALLEMSRDLRPPDYASLFVRLALDGGLPDPISVPRMFRPPWLTAVVEEVGVVTCSIEDALANYAAV